MQKLHNIRMDCCCRELLCYACDSFCSSSLLSPSIESLASDRRSLKELFPSSKSSTEDKLSPSLQRQKNCGKSTDF